MNPQRFGLYVLGTLGGIALLLTVFGTYVVAESMVVRRRRELGIRAALGARGAQLRSLGSLLYHVEPLDPVVLVSMAAGIFALALLVSLRPAFAATRLDLTRSLREE